MVLGFGEINLRRLSLCKIFKEFNESECAISGGNNLNIFRKKFK
jgi:hypothetical protein